MSTGYGRGHYGSDRLDRPRPPTGGWFKIAAVVGVGAIVWYLWPRKSVDARAAPDREAPLPPVPATIDEDAVVASARTLRSAGAAVALPPHLQHLTPRLEGA